MVNVYGGAGLTCVEANRGVRFVALVVEVRATVAVFCIE